jgi:hypothetical protein
MTLEKEIDKRRRFLLANCFAQANSLNMAFLEKKTKKNLTEVGFFPLDSFLVKIQNS